MLSNNPLEPLETDRPTREIRRESSLAERVRTCISLLMPLGGPGVEEVAFRLKMSARTVRRQLQDEGTSYREILDNLRYSLAIRQLGPERKSVEDVAYRLGFADASGFQKAFRRWTGNRPADYSRTLWKHETP